MITFIGCKKTESNPDKDVSKKESNYVILSIEGIEYGKFGIKEGVPFVNESRGKTTASISVGDNGLAITLLDGDVTATRGTIFVLFLKEATGILENYSFNGLTISGYDGSGANLNYRTDANDISFFFYNTGEKMNRTLPGGGTCNIEGSGILGKTVVKVTQFTRNYDNPKGIIEGNFTVRLYGNSVKDTDDCLSDRELNISGYFYVNN